MERPFVGREVLSILLCFLPFQVINGDYCFRLEFVFQIILFKHCRALQLVSELRSSALRHFMAEGT